MRVPRAQWLSLSRADTARNLVRLTTVAVVGPAVAAGLFILAYRRHASLVFEMGIVPPVAHGLYPAEQNPAGVTFAWTGPSARLSFAELDRRVAWTLALRLIVWRPPGVPLPEVAVSVDGARSVATLVTRDFEELRVVLPRRADRRGATVTIEVFPSFTPPSQDTRRLSIALDRVAVTPAEAWVLPPPRAVAKVAAAAAALGPALVLARASLASAAVTVLLMSGAVAWLGTRGLAPYFDYPRHVAWLAFWTAFALVLLVRLIERTFRGRLASTGRFVLIWSAAAVYLKLLVLVHPDMPVGDALFHAHRLQYVLAGRWFFTSVAPGEYDFPYPFALYLVAAPFAIWTRESTIHIVILRTLVTVADAAAGMLLYRMVAKAWNDRVAGAAAVATYHLFPLAARTMEWGNLTNAFGQSLFVLAAALMTTEGLRREHRRQVLGLTAAIAAACLSHPSTCAILITFAGLVGWLLRRHKDAAAQASAQAVARATTAAVLVAMLLYYAWFVDTYRAVGLRLGSELAASMVAPAWQRLVARLWDVPSQVVAHHGWPATLLALVGIRALARRPPSDRLRLLLGAWAGACLVFLLLGLLTPIDLRYYLADLPAVAIVAGIGWSRLWQANPCWRPVLAALAVWMLVIAVRVRVAALG